MSGNHEKKAGGEEALPPQPPQHEQPAIATTLSSSSPPLVASSSSSSTLSPSCNRPEYPIGVPSKFDRDGNVQLFPGNTIVAHLSPSSELYQSMLLLHNKLASLSGRFALAMLPPPSWHMTVFEGVCDKVRSPAGFWPCDLATDATLEECTKHFAVKLKNFELETGTPPYRCRITGFSDLEVGVGVHVEFETADEERRVRRLRDRLAERLEIRHPQHDRYKLHLSMAYLLRHLTEEQKRELTGVLMGHFEEMPKRFELGRPEFCTFENMMRFDRLFYLGEK
ncbi:RNA ligase/cyclic nucleotide phosphodiesterase [Apodospora peruviana]|uniref:RNA ligase/cyclic nucleotide phosphodiesterase n=1 Tax=Apodospora peruviana TaxID=516989 RepID=A0AAE0MG65_9PEZI|nr:RNA ligase/cyclic nucleotide phosphodiesterase [Apodospora peruviana]